MASRAETEIEEQFEFIAGSTLTAIQILRVINTGRCADGLANIKERLNRCHVDVARKELPGLVAELAKEVERLK